MEKDEPFAPISISNADSVLTQMTLDERIAQLFVVKEHENTSIEPGGYVIRLESQQADSITSGTEFMPFTVYDVLSDPSNSAFLTQSTIAKADSTARQEYWELYAQELSSKGVNTVIGPALDLYQNHQNPYTNHQSFGEDKALVSAVARQQIGIFKKHGVKCIAGSFPGLGSAERGYESAPPLLFNKESEFLTNDLFPFKAVINDGVKSVMMANAFTPGLDSVSGEMASGSPEVHAILRDKLGFKGLVWMNMSQKGGRKEINRSVVNPLLAGADVIIIQSHLDKRIKQVKTAIESGVISEEVINNRVKRILQSKLWLKKKKRFKRDSRELSVKKELATRKAVETSLTLLKNEEDLIPFKRLDSLKIALFQVGHEAEPAMEWYINRYAPADVYTASFNTLEKVYSSFAAKQSEYNMVVVVAKAEDHLNKSKFGMSDHVRSVLDRIVYTLPTVLAWQGNPNVFRNIDNLNLYRGICFSDEFTPYTNDLMLQALFGGRPFQGKLNRNVKGLYERKSGYETEKIRLAYGLPEEVGINRADLSDIDRIAELGLSELAYPGCQVWFAKNGIVVYNEAFGHHRYDNGQRVKITDIYDIASITKIAASTAGLLKLNTQNTFSLDETLSHYLGKMVDTTKYKDLNMREVLAHQAGLTPFIPFYTRTLSHGVPRYDVYSIAKSAVYPTQVARELYIRENYDQKMYRAILNHKLRNEKKYKYSDVGYYFAKKIIEAQSEMPLDSFLNQSFYKPLGLSYMGYNPLNRFSKKNITPTEFDRTFRKQLVHGYVHDPGAAMLGGVGGHAGLFSNANDLGIFMQMYLNGGSYGGVEFIDSTILADYIRCQFCDNDNRRGAGFDKPLRTAGNGPSCGCTSKEAFGHQGFTGTITWADPEEEVVYVFLSNRIYPSVNNKKLAELNIRTDIQQAFYDAILKNKDLAKNN